MSTRQRIYSAAPIWGQNLLLSAYGLYLRRLRYGAVGRSTLQALRATATMDVDEIERGQLATLSSVVAAAVADVPFYRARGKSRTAFDSLQQLAELPLLEKSDVQRAGRELISDRYRDRRLTEVHTGGTTGKPLAIYCDSATLQRNYAFFTAFKESAGVPDGARVATFAGRIIIPPGERRTYWRRNRAANTMLFSSYHIGHDSLAGYAQALADFQPGLIDSYPSSIEPIARYLIDRRIRTVRPAAVITSSETLFPEVRALLERAFGCPVYDQYGGAEMAAFIGQCRQGAYHVAPSFGVVEVLADGRPAAPGEAGEIVATGFINPVMPLLRYRTGDSAVLGIARCACGRAGPTLERIEGRLDDVIVTPEGRLVGRLDPIFKAVASLHETRIVQDAEDHVRVEMVVAGEFPRAMEQELEGQLRARLGQRMRIDLVRVPSIDRTASGKLRTTVNLVYRRSANGLQRRA